MSDDNTLEIKRQPRHRLPWGLLRGYNLAAVVTLLVGSGISLAASVSNTFSTGQVLTAEELNQNFNDLVNQLTAVEGELAAAQAELDARAPHFEKYVSTGQSIPQEVLTQIVYDTDFPENTHTSQNTSTGDITGLSGLYRITATATLVIDNTVVGERCQLAILKDGTTVAMTQYELNGTNVQTGFTLEVSWAGLLEPQETLSIRLLHEGDEPGAVSSAGFFNQLYIEAIH